MEFEQKYTHELIQWLNRNYPHLPLTMFDIGVRYGVHYLYQDLLKLHHFKVVGFEADHQEAENLRSNSKSGVTEVWPYAIAKTTGPREIYITKHPGCSSFYPPNQDLLSQYLSFDFFKITDKKIVEAISIDDFITRHKTCPPDFLKIDIQGAEYEALEGGKTALNRVIGIFLETQLREIYTGAPLFPDIHSLLNTLGFRLIFCEYNADLGGELVEFDVAYVRDVQSICSKEELLKLILFCCVHKNLDFAVNSVRNSALTDSEKQDILSLFSQPLQAQEMRVTADSPYISSNIELRKIHEDWWMD
ncbi:FkbM family methyltransferase [Acaryochloris sp. IP29b_bin.148]|uniref:FkbM family methyltransferase n=1 Tax=Acaryochloris sp. IP29b_bin.148 TaxID=2969218 RepID=UPI002625C63D|nr:FkbM family methyltransferase [Acaryochloris sp. IP29b_bin.148]